MSVKKRPGDLTPFLTPPPESPVDFLQGVLTAWNAGTFANTVDFGGGLTQTDLPIVGDPAALTVNDVVMVLRLRTRYFILGTITTP
jgi:hypothetical protein